MTAATLLGKICLGITLATLVIYCVAFACPYWLQKDFSINVPGFILNLPFPLNATMIPLAVSTHFGMFESCDKIRINMIGLPQETTEECGSEGARDWQYVAGGFGIAGLVLAILSAALSITVLCVSKKTLHRLLSVAVFICHFLTCIAIVVPVALYGTKTEFQVKPPLPDRVDFDLIWAFYLAVTSIVLYGTLAFLYLALICLPTAEKSSNGPAVHYTVDNPSFNEQK